MSELDQAITAAYAEPSAENTNKYYQVFFRTQFFLPIQAGSLTDEGDFVPLFQSAEGAHFIPVFSTETRLRDWAGEDMPEFVEVSGIQLVRGVGDMVFLCVDYDTDFYKEFAPDELNRLKGILSKFDIQSKLKATD